MFTFDNDDRGRLSFPFFLLLMCGIASIQGQTFSVQLQFNSTDCTGNPVWFQSVRDPKPCIPMPCSSISGSGSRIITCINGSFVVPPNNLYCASPECKWCRRDIFEGVDNCVLPAPSELRIIGLGVCVPLSGGFYTIYPTLCDTKGDPSATGPWYSDSACTVIHYPSSTPTTGPATCIPGGPQLCFNNTPGYGFSLKSSCFYGASSTTTVTGGGGTTTTPSSSASSTLGGIVSTTLLLIGIVIFV